MIILHAGAEAGRLLLWGESPAEVPAATKPGKAPPAEPRAYPFDAGVMRLVPALMELAPGQPIPGGGGEPPLLWLPTSKGRPHPSSGMIGDVPEAPAGGVELTP